MGTMELNKKVTELKELEQYIKEVQAEIDGIKDELKAEMTTRGAEEMTVGVFTLRYKEVSQKRFDSKAFQKDYEALYKVYQKESTSMRFTCQ